jgi:WD40 repeat protein
MASDPPKVLISFSHDSPEHEQSVLELANRLRGDGIDCTIDLYVVVPEEGWPLWMERQIRDSNFVLLICTETYLKRVLGEEQPGKGLGVRWEGNLIYNAIYSAAVMNTKFIPLLFVAGEAAYVPTSLQGTTIYEPFTNAGYEKLYRRLSNQPQAVKRELGKLPPGERKSEGALGRLVNVPNLPPHFLPRSGDLQALKDIVLAGLTEPVALPGAGKIGVQGMGGIGKTVLAVALARDPEVRHAFPEGVLWITFGQTPNIIARQSQVAETFGERSQAFVDVQQGKSRLSTLLQERSCLLILDDVWQVEHAASFDVLGERGRMLITTRDARIVTNLGSIEQRVDQLTDAEALTLLAQWSGYLEEELPELAKDVVKECGNLPLALAMVGARVKGDPEGWENVLHRLRHANLEKIQQQFSEYPYRDLLKAIQVSIDGLETEQLRERYLEFAVFPEKTPIPEAALQTFWAPLGMDKYEVQDALKRFVELSLMRREEKNCVSLHDLQYAYVRKRTGAGSLAALHERLIGAYRQHCKDGWPSGPSDGYYFERLPFHLKEADREAELRQLLFNFDWLQSKLEATHTHSLTADYNYLADADLRLVQSAIRLSAHILARDPRQLAGQLLGRLLGDNSPSIQVLLNQAVQWRAWPWLRPLMPSLTPPGGPMIHILADHMDGVRAVAVTPDGRRIVSGSNDRTLRVWDLESGQVIRTLEGHTRGVRAVAITPDGCRAVSGSNDRTLRLWDLASGQMLRALEGHTHGVRAVAVAPDGRRAISGSEGGNLHVWDLESYPKLRTIEAHRSSLNAVAVTPDGRRAISGSEGGNLRVWDLESGQKLRSLEAHRSALNAVAVTPDGRRAISGSEGGNLRVWDLESGQKLRSLEGHTGSVNAVAVTPDGRHAISASSDQTLGLWNLESGQMLRTIEGHTSWVNAVAITPDGRRAVSGSNDRTLRVWDLESEQKLHAIEGRRSAVNAVAVTPDGRRAVSGSGGGTLHVWDLESGQKLCTIEAHRSALKAVAVMPDGRRAISGSEGGNLRVWDLESHQKLRTIEAHRSALNAVAVTPDGRRAISGSEGGNLRVWDLESGQKLRSLEAHSGALNAVAVTPDGRRAISGSEGGNLRVWELESGQKLRSLEGHTGSVNAVAVTPDGRRAVSASRDNTLRVWDLESGQSLRTLEAHTDSVRAVAVTPDGRRAVSAGWDLTLRVWDLQTGKEITTFNAEGRMFSCAVAPDGRTIVAGDESGRVHFLRLVETEFNS